MGSQYTVADVISGSTVLGYKGSSFMESGIVYAPYIPVYVEGIPSLTPEQIRRIEFEKEVNKHLKETEQEGGWDISAL